MNNIDWKEVTRINPIFNEVPQLGTLQVSDVWHLTIQGLERLGNAIEDKVSKISGGKYSRRLNSKDDELLLLKASILEDIYETRLREDTEAKIERNRAQELETLQNLLAQAELNQLVNNPEAIKERINKLKGGYQ